MTARPAPLFDLVTGFPPDDAVDVTLSLPVTLAIWMTVLESTGHAADVATLRTIHIEEARETVRLLQTLADELTGPEVPPGTPLRVTHILEDRIRGVSGLRPHLHAYVGVSVRPAGGGEHPVDVDVLARRAGTDVLAAHRARIVAATRERCGLEWGPAPWSPHELVEPAWLLDRAAGALDEPTCPGPWPRRQLLGGGPT